MPKFKVECTIIRKYKGVIEAKNEDELNNILDNLVGVPENDLEIEMTLSAFDISEDKNNRNIYELTDKNINKEDADIIDQYNFKKGNKWI